MKLIIFLLLFFFTYAQNNQKERCLNGYQYRLDLLETTVSKEQFANILGYAFPFALAVKIDATDNAVYAYFKEEQELSYFFNVLNLLKFQVKYVNLLITSAEYDNIKDLLIKYEIKEPFDQYFYTAQCKVYIPPSEDASKEEVDKVISIINTINSYVNSMNEYLNSIKDVIQGAVGVTQTLKNIYQGSYQIYQFLTGRSSLFGEVCPDGRMYYEPPLPPYALLKSIQFNGIPPTGNDFEFMVELLSNISTESANKIFLAFNDPENFHDATAENASLNLFIGGNANTFGVQWDDVAKTSWINIMKNLAFDNIYVTLQMNGGAGRKGEPEIFPSGTSTILKFASFTSKYYPFKYEFSKEVSCPGEPAVCSFYKQLIINKKELQNYFASKFVKCVK